MRKLLFILFCLIPSLCFATNITDKIFVGLGDDPDPTFMLTLSSDNLDLWSHIVQYGYNNEPSASLGFVGNRFRGTKDIPLPVVENDSIYIVVGAGWDGIETSVDATYLESLVDGVVSENIVPGRFEFKTCDTAGVFATRMTIKNDGKVGIGTDIPTAYLHLAEGTSTLAPFKLTAGTKLNVIEDGAMEYDGSHLYFSVGVDRFQIDQQGGGGAVTSVFGRTGDVVAATNDYTWAQIDKTTSDLADLTTKSHTSLTSIGTNTHAQIDNHLASTSNPHSTTAAQVSAVALTGDETVAGVKTFTSSPIVPTPTTDMQASTKKYADDLFSQSYIWQDAVKDKDLSAEPVSPTTGDRYIVNYVNSDAIIDADSGSNRFVIAGDQTSNYAPNDVIIVRGSTGNDGWWHIQNCDYHAPPEDPAGTWIMPFETITDDTNDGTMYVATTGDKFGQAGPYKVVQYNGADWDVETPANWELTTLDDNYVWGFDIDDYIWTFLYPLSTYTFINGLTYASPNVKLGGALTEATTLTLGNYKLNFDVTGTGFVGIDTTTPNSYLQINGSKSEKITLLNATETLTLNATHHTIWVDCSAIGDNVTINLPTSIGIDGREYTVKKIDATAYTVTILPASEAIEEKIEGVGDYKLSSQNEWVTFKADGIDNWWITGKAGVGPHQANHNEGGSDELKLDDLAATDDNTDLNSSTSKHGLMMKYPNTATGKYLAEDGTWTVPPGSGSESDNIVQLTADRTNATTSFADVTGLGFTATANKDYIIDAYIMYTTSATTVGINLACNGSTAATAIVGQTVGNTAATTIAGREFKAYNSSGGTLTAAISGNNIAIMHILLRNGGSSSNFIIRFAAETTGSVVVKTGSTIRYRQVN